MRTDVDAAARLGAGTQALTQFAGSFLPRVGLLGVIVVPDHVDIGVWTVLGEAPAAGTPLGDADLAPDAPAVQSEDRHAASSNGAFEASRLQTRFLAQVSCFATNPFPAPLAL